MVATGKSHVDCCNWKGFGKREGVKETSGRGVCGERGKKREEGIRGRKKGRMREENLERKKER